MFIVAVALGVMFTACENNEVAPLNTHNYTDEEILSAVKFVGQGGISINNNSSMMKAAPGMVTIIRATLGRKSKNCEGFGICSISIGPWDLYNETPMGDNEVVILYYEDITDLNSIKLLLAEQPDIDMQHILLAIDEDITIENNLNDKKERTTIPANQYEFDVELGSYGGFSLPMEIK